ncbi:hypothetical protein ACLVWQ_17010 [Streptomyces sp. CWNU-52B]|uniref:hypothetical protein n=1 Tax=unclassified Streptomyces TaxID=2593676 RepID=UPI0039C3E680
MDSSGTDASVIGRGRSNSAPAGLGLVAPPLQPSQEEQEAAEQRRRVASVSVDAAAAGGRRPGVLAERRRQVGAVAAGAAAEGRRREEAAEARRRREEAEAAEQRRRVASVSADAAAAGGRRPGVLAERRRQVGAVAADAATEGRRREVARTRRRAVAVDAAAEGRRREEAAAAARRRREETEAAAREQSEREAAAAAAAVREPEQEQEQPERVGVVAAAVREQPEPEEAVVAVREQPERDEVAAVEAQPEPAGVVAPAVQEQEQPEREEVVAAVQEQPERQEAAAAERRRREAAEAEERRQRAEEAEAEEQRQQEAATAAAAAAQTQSQPAEKQRRSALRRLAGARAKLKKVTGKIRQILATPSKADKTKKVLDQPDTVANRINAPTEGGVRVQAQATGDTGQVQATAIVTQVDTGINAVTDVLGVVNDLRALKTAFKSRNDTGPASHKPSKDRKGKPLGVAQGVGMVGGDATGAANAGIRNAGELGGMAALGEATGAFSIFYSTVIAARDSAVVWKTYKKNSEIKKMALGGAGATPGSAGQLQDVHDQLGQVQQQTARAGAAQGQGGGGAGIAAEAGTEIAAVGASVHDVDQLLRAELAEIIQYARHKQHTKMGKRIASLGGNTVRTAGGSLAIAAAVGAISGPAAPAVAGVAAALLLSGALYKGARAGSNRYVAARHPDRWARPTPAQVESRTDRPETAATSDSDSDSSSVTSVATPEPAARRDAVKEFFKVTKSVQQGERHFMAQKLYALAAGEDVSASRNPSVAVRASAYELLRILNCGPSHHKQSPEEWVASLNDPTQQSAWEKEIANQLSSA